MSTPVSVRFPEDVAGRLRRRSTRTGEPASGLVVRLVDEGMRMEEHPGVVFRDGPAGRRAGHAAAVKKTARWLGLSEAQVRAAEGYYGAYPTEIDDRIAENVAAADDAQRASAARARLYG